MNTTDLIDRLPGLYSATGHDWELAIHHILTEPVCPTVMIRPEGWEITRYSAHASTIEEGLELVIARIRTEIFDRKLQDIVFTPWTNPDDAAFSAWLEARAKGSDEHLPYLKREFDPETPES